MYQSYGSYCWWLKSGFHQLRLVVELPLFTRGFIHVGWLALGFLNPSIRHGLEYLHHRKRTCPLKMDCFSSEYIRQPLIFRGPSLVFRGHSPQVFAASLSSDPPTFPPDIKAFVIPLQIPFAPRSNKFFFRSEAAENFPRSWVWHTKKDGENGKKTPRAARFPIGMLERVTLKKRRCLLEELIFQLTFWVAKDVF